MPVYDDEAPRLAEIGRRLDEVGQNLFRLRDEVRQLFNEHVRKDTYLAEQAAMLLRIGGVDSRITNLESRLRTLAGLFYGSLSSILVGVVLFWIIGSR